MRLISVLLLFLLSSAVKAQKDDISVQTECFKVWHSANTEYEDWKTREVTDVSNFRRSVALFERTIKKCSGQPLEQAAKPSLANANYFIGDWAKAKTSYCQIKDSDPVWEKMCLLLTRCKGDVNLETLRRGNIHELHGNFVGARELYRKVSTAKCPELAVRGKDETERISKYILTRPP